MSNQLSSKVPLAYAGTNATRPPNMFVYPRAPTPTDYQNYQLGDYWLYRVSLTSNNGKLYVLLGLVANVANWALITSSAGNIEFLQGNSGGPVGPNASQIINVVGDGSTITVAGDPSTNTLTISTMGTGTVDSLTTDDGHVVTPTGGTINVLTGLSTLNCGSTVEFTGTVGPNTVMLNVTSPILYNTIIGHASGNTSISGSLNTVVGSEAAESLTGGENNCVLGFGALFDGTTATQNIAIGVESLEDLITGANNIAIGHISGNNYTGAESDNILLNSSGIITESNTLHIGSGTGTGSFQLKAAYISGIDGVNVGSVATVVTEHSDKLGTAVITAGSGISVTPTANTITIATAGTVPQSFPTDSGTATPSGGVLNIKAGVSTQNCGSSVEFTGSGNTVTLNVTDANNNTVIGNGSGAAITSGTSNTILGKGSGTAITTESGAVIIGDNAGIAGEPGVIRIGNTASGGGIGNIFIGQGTGNLTYTVGMAQTNIFIGETSGSSITTGAGNTTLGYAALNSCTTGLQNNAFGNLSLDACTTGQNNTADGFQSMRQLTTGSFNTAVGENVLYRVTSGSYNCAIGGNGTGGNYTGAESSNILIMNAGGLGESNVMRVGTSGAGNGQVNQAFIAGIRGVTTTNADAVAVLIDSAGQLGTVSSSIRYKENVKDMADESSPLMKLRPVTFNYKKHGNKDYGLIAEEVAETFPELVIFNDQGEPETVKYHILCSILLNEVQKLSKRIEELEKRSSS